MDYTPAQPPAESLTGFGVRLQWARRHRAMRQVDLAEQSGITRNTINALENDQRSPRIKTVCLLSTALNVEAAWLAFGDGESGLPEGEPEYVPPVPFNKKVGLEERMERRQINQVAHRRAQVYGTSFVAEREAIRAAKAAKERDRQREADEVANMAEAESRYGFNFAAYERK